MSGVEALAVISILANITQLVDFSEKIVDRVKEYNSDVQRIPKAFRDVQIILPLIAVALQETQKQVSSGQVAEDKCKAIQPVLRECKAKLVKLGEIFERTLLEDGTSKVRRWLTALASLQQEKKVEEISEALGKYLQTLMYYHVVSAPTALEIVALTESISNVTLGAAPATAVMTYFIVPSLPTMDFTGREETMRKLEAELCLPDKHSRVALVGLGGIGKTRVALEFAHNCLRSTETSVFWVHAHNAERMKTSYEDIARKVAIPGYQDPAVDVLQLVKDWFENVSPGKWLMIVDNADDSELLYSSSSQPVCYAEYLPRSDHGSILLTTRNGRVGRRFAAASSVVTLSAMSIEESESLLSTHLDAESTNNLFKELAEQLERIPLALVQAAAFMRQNCVSIERYLQLYRISDLTKVQLLSEEFEDEVRHPLSKNPVATTWSISFEYIQKHDPQAAELLSFMSMLANQAVLELLLPPGDDPVTFEKALGTLQGFSFISLRQVELGQSQYRLLDYHRLVRLAMRNWLKISAKHDAWVAVAVSRLRNSGLTESFNAHYMQSQLMPHVVEVLAADVLQGTSGSRDVPKIFLDRKPDRDCVHNDTICPHCTANLLHYVAVELYHVDDNTRARVYAQRATVLKTYILGEADESTLESAIVLVRVTTNATLSDYGYAKTLCREFIKVSKAERGLGDYYTLYFTAELMKISRKDPDSEQDTATSKQLLEDYEAGISQIGASEDLKLLTLASDIHYVEGRYHEAVEYGLRALDGDIEMIGLVSRERIWVLSIIACSKRELHQYEEAEKYGRMSLGASTRCYGHTNPATLICMSTLAEVLRYQQKIVEAKALSTTLLKLTAQVYGETSPTYFKRSYWHYRAFKEEM